MTDLKLEDVAALKLESLIDKMPEAYLFFDEDGESYWIAEDHPQFAEAKAAYERKARRAFRR